MIVFATWPYHPIISYELYKPPEANASTVRLFLLLLGQLWVDGALKLLILRVVRRIVDVAVAVVAAVAVTIAVVVDVVVEVVDDVVEVVDDVKSVGRDVCSNMTILLLIVPHLQV